MQARELILAVAVATTLGCVGDSATDDPPRPNILLISIDTLRADHVGCYGYERATTPMIDALAARGVRFANAFSPASWTLPAHMSLMTSQYPHVHRVDRQDRRLGPDTTTLAEQLSRHGYYNAAFVSWFYVAARFGFDRGFDEYHEYFPRRNDPDLGIRAEVLVDDVVAWLSDRRDRPFFLFLHLFDPHMGYNPPPPYDQRWDPDYRGAIDGSYRSLRHFIQGIPGNSERIGERELQQVVALYDGEIAYTDSQVARLVEALHRLELEDETLIVLTSDHGEEFDDHGSMEGHQWTLYDEVTRVPLIIVPPDASQPRVEDRIVELLDIAPTLLRAARLPVPESFQGRALLGEADADKRWAYGEIRRFNHKWSVRDERYKLIFTGGPERDKQGASVARGYELYDLLADPRELRNTYREEPTTAAQLAGRLRRFIEAGVSRPDREDGPVQFTEEELERLRSLGYVQ